MTFGESMETNVHPDITLEHCANWSSPSSTHTISPSPLNLFKPSTARAEFTLPLTSPSLQVLSHGPSVGNFRIVQDADGHSAEGVRVEVLAKYRGKQAVEHVKVCSFTRQGNEGLVEGEGHGVIILVSARVFPAFKYPILTSTALGPQTIALPHWLRDNRPPPTRLLAGKQTIHQQVRNEPSTLRTCDRLYWICSRVWRGRV